MCGIFCVEINQIIKIRNKNGKYVKYKIGIYMNKQDKYKINNSINIRLFYNKVRGMYFYEFG